MSSSKLLVLDTDSSSDESGLGGSGSGACCALFCAGNNSQRNALALLRSSILLERLGWTFGDTMFGCGACPPLDMKSLLLISWPILFQSVLWFRRRPCVG